MKTKTVGKIAMVATAMALAIAPFKANAEEPSKQQVPVTWDDGGHFFTAAAPVELNQMMQLKLVVNKDGDVGSAARVVKKTSDRTAARIMSSFDATGQNTGTTIDFSVGDGNLATGAAMDIVPSKDSMTNIQGRLAIMKSILLGFLGIRITGELAGGNPAGYIDLNILATGTTCSTYFAKDSRIYGIDQDVGPITLFGSGDEKGNLSGGIAAYPKFGHLVLRFEDGVFATGTNAKPPAGSIILGIKF